MTQILEPKVRIFPDVFQPFLPHGRLVDRARFRQDVYSSLMTTEHVSLGLVKS